NNGLLDKQTYLPAVQRGWEALNAAVTPEGKLMYVQQIGAKPESVKQEDNQEYGTGAFLMAGTEMLKLKK
ncbi:MAG: glycoside hydrolase family 88 protein, partial [Bacteroidota bacterium]|nr:glycoside hydrolase family 88 protein [Bacteroidota bacterium]